MLPYIRRTYTLQQHLNHKLYLSTTWRPHW